MAHDHHHHPDEMNNYLVQQIFTVAICGALGAVAVSLYLQDTLQRILAPLFHKWVLMGGIALLVMVVIRGLTLWRLAGQLQKTRQHQHEHDHHHQHHHHDHDHDHHHEPEKATVAAAPAGSSLALNVIEAPAPAAPVPEQHCCGHDHAHDHGKDHKHAPESKHDHDHDHNTSPWRLVLLLLPVALFMMDFPNAGFSGEQKSLQMEEFDLTAPPPEANGEAEFRIGFLGLERAALSSDSRQGFRGKTVSLTGQFAGLDDNRFTLVRYKMNCCAADAIKLNAAILLDPSKVGNPKLARLTTADYRNKWVSVTGRVDFLNKRGTNEYVTALIVTPTSELPLSKLVKIVPPDSNPYAD